jgi:hypothetical protein
MQLIKIRIKGSSLMEVVTAMVIISLSIALTGALLGNVLNSSQRMLKQQAWFMMNEIGNNALINKDIADNEIDRNTLVFRKKSFAIDKEKGLWFVVFEAEDRTGKILARRRLLVETFDATTKD